MESEDVTLHLCRKKVFILSILTNVRKLEEAAHAIRQIVKSGRKFCSLLQKQAKEVVKAEAQRANMPYVTERWLGAVYQLRYHTAFG